MRLLVVDMYRVFEVGLFSGRSLVTFGPFLVLGFFLGLGLRGGWLLECSSLKGRVELSIFWEVFFFS